MDSSILNFLAITLKNRETAAFDPNLLQEKLKQEQLQVNPETLELQKATPTWIL